MITFAMIKPHVVKNPIALKQIMAIISENNFRIVRKNRIHFTKESAENFYQEHNGKFYFNRLVTFMMRYNLRLLSDGKIIKSHFQWTNRSIDSRKRRCYHEMA